ncbi:vancomycin resistance protein YoaR [Peptoniphilus olsenii]|uniref:Vancomycin resistance protein YoaR n=1 Tax=Peptoniphilus olsenii TaxID=411570 RepID=A0ABV2J9I5_9FIRM
MESIKSKIEDIDRRFLVASGIVLAMILVSLIFYSIEKNNSNIHKGVKIEGISVSHMSKNEAIKKVKEETDQKIAAHIINFTFNDESYPVSLEQFGYTLDLEQAADKAYEIGRSKSSIKNFFQIVFGPIFSNNIIADGDLNRDSLDKVILDLNKKIYIKPEDAYIKENSDGSVDIIEEKIGRYMDNDEFGKILGEDFINKDKIELPVYSTEPNVKSNYYAGIDKVYADFETNYSSSSKGRKENIRLASSKFNNLKVEPGQEISFNNVVGDVTADKGFKEATVIIGGNAESGIGGGICQVSTTLYNSLVMSDLEIVERHNHSRPINYVKLGTDAAVVSDYKDLKFKNNTNNPILIQAIANGDNLSFKIFGNSKDRDYTVKMVPKLLGVVNPNTITRYSDNMYEGDQVVKEAGSKGYSYETFKEVIKDGKIISTEKITNSYYIPKDRVVVIGTRENDKEETTDED